MQTGNEKILPTAGDIQIRADNNTISYKTIGKAEVPCEKPKDPVCFPGDTYKYAYEPVGSLQTQLLP
jgi:hypothetical protein